ncbi:LPS-assembly protein LptD [Pseudorhodoplanes sp.]|uniref:LPS-assembly protein LptD n=1 Tax=Pseudorhodoplanes sp. TaxID=1934341 RepID=UPI002C2C7BDE|nr:LPS-assembly protein LptD [Pseudorhodoplanes sp.]HWV44167.1 LPS-assembly protein LptD [Pseudorhodoplanes sp.]
MALRNPSRPGSIGRAVSVAATTCIAVALLGLTTVTPAQAQTDFFRYPDRAPMKPPAFDRNAVKKGDKQMLVQADEVQYDHVNHRVSAVGNVQIYYDGSTIEADRLVYNQETKRLRAEGNVRLTEPGGNITYGEILELNDDYRDGFVDSMRVETPDQTRFAAARVERSEGRYSVLQSGVYTACEPCKTDPRKPPLWQVKGARIIHDDQEKMIYFEQGTFELFGLPIAYFPYMSTPDPTVKRKSGWLMPFLSNSTKLGFTAQVPYFWALAPNYDLTLIPSYSTKQGPFMSAEFRHRLLNGAYSIRASGIKQMDMNEFMRADGVPTPGYREWRGAIESNGQFGLNRRWVWGWDALLISDKTFYQDYPVQTFTKRVNSLFQDNNMEGLSQLYLVGRGNRSYFDARTMYFYGFSEFDDQKQLPVVHPVIDYTYVVGQPVLGGELGFRFNLTSVSRNTADFDAINNTAALGNYCGLQTADPAIKNTNNCVLRGAPGSYSRLSAETTWKRTVTDPLGQVFTPFVSLRADVASVNISNQPGVSNFIETKDSGEFRGMPVAGLEYRYPFINIQPWGTTTVEPIAQVIARPNETKIGKLPNEDAQSFVFDDGNLFRVDKFSGWDRVEGGGRANYGVQLNTQFNQGGFINILFGQSYQLFGTNSFAVGDAANTGLNSGLDTRRSDYVARVAYQPDRIFTFTTRYRFDEQNFEMRRFELEGRADFDRISLQALYGNYDKQPELGFLTRREGILGGASWKFTDNWAVIAAARYDIDASSFDQTRLGLGYIDDCLILALNYITSYTYSGNPTKDHRLMLQMSLRTLGNTSFTTGTSGLGGL